MPEKMGYGKNHNTGKDVAKEQSGEARPWAVPNLPLPFNGRAEEPASSDAGGLKHQGAGGAKHAATGKKDDF